jgi:hypothetical protein
MDYYFDKDDIIFIKAVTTVGIVIAAIVYFGG